MATKAITLPFTFNGPKSFYENLSAANLGTISTTTDEKKIWRDRVILVLSTRFYERLMRPDFGSDINRTIFENEASAKETASRTITIAFNTWLSALKLNKISADFDINTGFMSIEVFYLLPSGRPDSAIVNTAVFSRSGDVIQETTNG